MLHNFCAMKWSNYYIVDIVVVAILIVFTILAARKGFINCMLGFIVTSIAILVAVIFADNLVEASGGIFGLEKGMSNWLVEVLSKNELFNRDVSAPGLTKSLQDANVPGFIADAIVKEFGNSSLPEGTTLASLVGPKVSSFICLLMCGALLFLFVKLLGFFVGKILKKKVQSISLMGKLNVLFGALIGFIEGFLIVCSILSILSIFVTSGVTAFFDQTLFVGKWFHNNPLGQILGLIGF